MSEEQNRSIGCSSGFLNLLALLFVGLKLTGYINWPWLWVLAPIWIPLGIGLVVLTFVLLAFLFVEAGK